MEKLTLEEKNLLINHRIGKWFSEIIMEGEISVYWECPNGHRWKATPDSFRHEQNCPICQTHFSEKDHKKP